MKTINIKIPAFYEIDLEKCNLNEGKIVFKKSAKKLPKSWEELEEISGFYSDIHAEVQSAYRRSATSRHKDLFVTKEQAKASNAFAQLSQLREVYRQDWVPDWKNTDEIKYVIYPAKNILAMTATCSMHHYLSFQSKEICKEFLENFRELIWESMPLMS
jgi:hypothetical protein